MNNWFQERLSKLPAKTRFKVAKSLNKDNDLDSQPLEKPKQPSDYSIWFHLMLDAFECKNLDNHERIKAFFSELINSTGMKPLSDIIIKTVDNEEGRGTSAIQMIVTSSITYHADDKYHNVFIDFFSCKSFSPKQVIGLVEKYFKPRKINHNFIYRKED